jgi:N-acetylglucosaminyldiphosphoundecaprenol N-acetyl-beta-D-mannosaminyltransferase
MRKPEMNMRMPRVSIIMNVRNGRATLPEALDSVLAQGFTDWELIFWDDCSTDDSARVLNRYRDSRILYYLSPQSNGLGQARYSAIRKARGEWLAFLDQDDIWLPHKLQRQIALADNCPDLGIVYGRTLAFLPSGRQRDFDHRHEFEPLPEGNIYRELFVNSCFICMSSAMLFGRAVQEVGGIPEFIRTTPDYYLFLSIAKCYSARAAQEVVCRYRIHSGNMSGSLTARIHEEAIWSLGHHAHALEPGLVARRRQVHSTVWGLAEIRGITTAAQGLRRIIGDGSLTYLLSRPFAKTYRAIRRRLRRPYWKLTAAERQVIGATAANPTRSVQRVWARAMQNGNKLLLGQIARPARVRLLGTMVSASSLVAAQDLMSCLVEQGVSAYISCANAYSLSLALEQPHYQKILNQAMYLTADGMPVVWALRRMGYQAERVHNDDLFVACCHCFPEWRHFFVGGRSGQPEEVTAAAQRRFPGIKIVGSHPTPVRPVPSSDTEIILQKIRNSQPSVIWVGMGTPAQDEWMAEASPLVNVPMVAVGSLFDLLSGRTKSAPQWMKRAGLQWLFRLCQEPRRLARRYLVYNSIFLAELSREKIAKFISGRG